MSLAPSQLETALGYGADTDIGERTTGGMDNLEKFEGMGAPRDQLHYPPKVLLAIPQEHELSEIKAVP